MGTVLGTFLHDYGKYTNDIQSNTAALTCMFSYWPIFQVAHRDEHIYTYKIQPSTPSCEAKQDCGINPYLLSSNKSRPHLSTYIPTRKRQEGEVLMFA